MVVAEGFEPSTLVVQRCVDATTTGAEDARQLRRGRQVIASAYQFVGLCNDVAQRILAAVGVASQKAHDTPELREFRATGFDESIQSRVFGPQPRDFIQAFSDRRFSHARIVT